MKFCSECGAPVAQQIPPGDNRLRHVCTHCQVVHYENPKVVAGCIPEWQDKILLCRRAIEPRYGLWTLPAGFMENDETTLQAAARETWEEAAARVRIEALYALFNLPHINQIYVMFRGPLERLEYAAGSESLEVALYDEQDIPWDTLAFAVVRETLRLYFADRRAGKFRQHMGDIVRVGDNEGGYSYRVEMMSASS